MTQSIAINATPVGFAHPPISPKSPGLLVNNHSFKVKFAEFMTGSLTTTRPAKIYVVVLQQNIQPFIQSVHNVWNKFIIYRTEKKIE